MREILAYVGAGIAAVLTRFALVFMFHIDGAAFADPPGVRIPPMLVFFAVLVLIDRRALQGINSPGQRWPSTPMTSLPRRRLRKPRQQWPESSVELRMISRGGEPLRRISQAFPHNRADTFYLLLAIWDHWTAWVGSHCILRCFCLLWALGLFFLPRTEYHSPVRVRGDWLDRIGAFWLVGCVFGPFFGWVVFQLWPMTPTSWHWGYGLRAFLAAGLPVLLALPLLRYARGKSSLVVLPLLLVITLLPVSTAIGSIQDLLRGLSCGKRSLWS